jgi:hypothetical protein
MAEVTKTIGDWEKQKGFLVPDASVLKKVTEDEFDLLPGKVGVNFEQRTEFLTSNGYPVTRENLIDANLSARSDEQ